MITTTPLGGFSSPITLQCTNLPQYASCDFEPPIVTPNGIAITSKLVVKTEMFQAQVPQEHRRLPLKPELPTIVIALAGMLFLVARWPRAFRKPAFVWAAITIVALITLTSCAGIPPAAILKTPPGDYTITVNSSGNVGAAAEMHTVSVTVTVTP
jgi:hypothetical protein